RSLPFPTDPFFAALRECYDRRPRDPDLNRLTFCLLGIATPLELVQDEAAAPFVVGRGIELEDFTPEEAAPLAGGFSHHGVTETRREGEKGQQRRLLDRILYWTGGHPYLTQRLCAAISEGMQDGGK